jgi:DNA-directed RNA polymerase subunit RPC12/RpoP
MKTRCRCYRCGAHVVAKVVASTVGIRCSTCGSWAVLPLEPRLEAKTPSVRHVPAEPPAMPRGEAELAPSQDAAIVLALAGTAVPFACSPEDEAERWVRVLRLHGQVGNALQSLGVGEAPLETTAQPAPVQQLRRRPDGEDIVAVVSTRAHEFATNRGASAVSTVDVLFALFSVYGKTFDRALYIRGTSREELVERLPAGAGVSAADGAPTAA